MHGSEQVKYLNTAILRVFLVYVYLELTCSIPPRHVSLKSPASHKASRTAELQYNGSNVEINGCTYAQPTGALMHLATAQCPSKPSQFPCKEHRTHSWSITRIRGFELCMQAKRQAERSAGIHGERMPYVPVNAGMMSYPTRCDIEKV
jgi:hypothetical protein